MPDTLSDRLMSWDMGEGKGSVRGEGVQRGRREGVSPCIRAEMEKIVLLKKKGKERGRC